VLLLRRAVRLAKISYMLDLGAPLAGNGVDTPAAPVDSIIQTAPYSPLWFDS